MPPANPGGVIVLGMLFLALFLAAASYIASVNEWRAAHQAEVSAEDGWLSWAGLFFLEEGPNDLPGLGIFTLRNGKVSFAGHVLEATNFPVGSRKVQVITRGGRTAIRVRDNNSQMRRNFKGLRWFPIREEYRVMADWIPYPQPKQVAITNMLGQTENQTAPGYAEFTLDGRRLRLEPVTEDDKLFFTFRDKTAGRQTYPAVRFLYADAPKGGHVILDFNLAHSPACAFTEFATCPLPRPANILPIAIEAGELYTPKPEHH